MLPLAENWRHLYNTVQIISIYRQLAMPPSVVLSTPPPLIAKTRREPTVSQVHEAIALDSFSPPLRLVLNRVQAGFQFPATDYIEEGLDLNDHLVRHCAADQQQSAIRRRLLPSAIGLPSPGRIRPRHQRGQLVYVLQLAHYQMRCAVAPTRLELQRHLPGLSLIHI